MKNLFFIAMLFLVFSCGGEAKSDANTDKTTSKSAETEQNQANSDITTPQSSTTGETKVLAKNDVKAVVEVDNTATETPARNISAKDPTTSKSKSTKPSTTSTVKNSAEAKAQMEAEKAKSMAEKMRLEEEMKKAETAKNEKEAAAEKMKKEMEERAKANAAKKENEVDASKEKPTAAAGLHDDFDLLLKKYVNSSGKVNYQGLKNDESKLDAYLKSLESTDVAKNWSRNQTLAFWINAYNANTIKLILKNYPVKSIMDLHNGKPWDVKWIKIDQRTLSLNNIENDIIRPTYNEPRIHFAVNCAAKSCPPLLNKAWTESNLNSNLEKQAKSFINNSNYNTITSGNVEVSKIFDWYGKDFGDLRKYLNKFSSTQIAGGTSINFRTYDWSLNN